MSPTSYSTVELTADFTTIRLFAILPTQLPTRLPISLLIRLLLGLLVALPNRLPTTSESSACAADTATPDDDHAAHSTARRAAEVIAYLAAPSVAATPGRASVASSTARFGPHIAAMLLLLLLLLLLIELFISLPLLLLFWLPTAPLIPLLLIKLLIRPLLSLFDALVTLLLILLRLELQSVCLLYHLRDC